MDEEAILAVISKILKFDNVVRLNIDARTGMVDFWRIPEEQETEEEGANPFRSVLKQVQMEEYSSEKEETGEQQFFAICEILADAGCFPVFVLTGREVSKLRKWIPFPRRLPQIAGVPIIPDPDLMEDVILVCGSKTKDAEPVDVTFVVKMTLP